MRELDPGYFALVMATGILATAARSLDLVPISWILLVIAVVGYLVLVGLNGLRLLHHPSAVVRDLDEPARSFGFFTFVAGSNVLAVALIQIGFTIPAAVLGFIGTAAWVCLTYAVPLRLMLGTAQPSSLEFVSGNWLLWVVATQSVASVFAAAPTSSAPGTSPAFSVIGFMTWGVGVILYVVLIGFILMRLFFATLTPLQLTPPYWINMGAAAISALSGALLLAAVTHPGTQLGEVRPFIAGLSLILWAWASWWIPALVLIWLWRHWSRGVPLTYEASLWSLVFPLGMYSAASVELGLATDQSWLVMIARIAFPVALGAWLWTFAGTVSSWRRALVDGHTAEARQELDD